MAHIPGAVEVPLTYMPQFVTPPLTTKDLLACEYGSCLEGEKMAFARWIVAIA
jgi:hypothetical protein